MEKEINGTEIKYRPNATTITNESLDNYPNIKYFFEILVKNTPITSKHVGRSYNYNEDVIKHKYYSPHGLFMDYFIRKHLSNQFNMDITDTRTEYILENWEKFKNEYDESLHDDIQEHYEIFKDSKTQAMDILQTIQIVSYSHLIYFGYGVPKSYFTVNEDNLREIIRYLKQLPYKSVVLNPLLTCDYFYADADLIFDNEIIYEIKTSKHQSLTYDERKIPLSKFYQPIIYGFGFYKKTGIKIHKYKIYNPLLGDEFSIELNNIDFELFEKVLKHDVTLNSRIIEAFQELTLKLSLFGETTNDDDDN
ncbi:uncharacterized protein ACRADG_005337 [Cochliomyia hominivorax]